jgi:16S rRNA (guanine966-N2)-methyltransferase
MRVIAGELGGRRLKAPAGRVTRPTSDRVREAVFGMLGDVGGASVLDLFAGTGALGIEALSRGAQSAVFVERDAGVLKVLQGNLAALGISPETVEVRRADALEALRSAKLGQETYDLVFIDPPYGRARPAPSASGPPIGERWGPQLSAILPALLSLGARVVVESDRRAPLELQLPHTGAGEPERSRRYGDTSITIHLHQ